MEPNTRAAATRRVNFGPMQGSLSSYYKDIIWFFSIPVNDQNFFKAIPNRYCGNKKTFILYIYI